MPALKRMYLNDQLGCCVIAGMAHLDGVFTGNNGDDPAVIYSDHRIEELYSAIGGYVPGDSSTDHGCNEIAALNYWRDKGLMPDQSDHHQIEDWGAIDASKPRELELAIDLMEGIMFGIELPDAWLENVTPGMTLDVAGEPDPDNGHCVVAVDYLPDGRLVLSTWGMEVYMTQAAAAAYATTRGQGEAYAVLSNNVVERKTQKAPTGFDFAQLRSDLQAIRRA